MEIPSRTFAPFSHHNLTLHSSLSTVSRPELLATSLGRMSNDVAGSGGYPCRGLGYFAILVNIEDGVGLREGSHYGGGWYFCQSFCMEEEGGHTKLTRLTLSPKIYFDAFTEFAMSILDSNCYPLARV